MSLSADDEFLNIIAHQARVAYATQQLAACREALQAWGHRTENGDLYAKTEISIQPLR